MAILKLNGSTYFVNVNKIKIDALGGGHWIVTYDSDRSFEVLGGAKSGGARNEWFCRHPLFYGDNWLPCKSMIEAIRLGAQY